MTDTNLTNRHRFEGMADAYENAIELAEVVSGKHSNPIDV